MRGIDCLTRRVKKLEERDLPEFEDDGFMAAIGGAAYPGESLIHALRRIAPNVWAEEKERQSMLLCDAEGSRSR